MRLRPRIKEHGLDVDVSIPRAARRCGPQEPNLRRYELDEIPRYGNCCRRRPRAQHAGLCAHTLRVAMATRRRPREFRLPELQLDRLHGRAVEPAGADEQRRSAAITPTR